MAAEPPSVLPRLALSLNPYVWQGALDVGGIPTTNLEPARLAETMRRGFSSVRDVETPAVSRDTVRYRVRIEPLWFTLLSFGIPFGALAWSGYRSGDSSSAFVGLVLGLVALYVMSGVTHAMWRANVRAWLRRGSLPPAR